jgi:hypothetical protein
LAKLSVSDFQNPNRIVFSDWLLFILFFDCSQELP